jgi:hypothetical protein
MNALRKLLCFLTASVLAGFSLQAAAASDRLFTLELCLGTYTTASDPQCVLSPPASTPTKTLSAKIKNVSLSNVSFNSIDLSVDLAWTFQNISNIRENGVTPPGMPTVDTSTPGHVKISNVPSVGQGVSLTFTFDPSSASCGDGTFFVSVWTGTGSGNGLPFNPVGTYPVGQPVPCNDIACGETISTASGVIAITRDPYNKDGTYNTTPGSSCAPVNFYASNTSGNSAGLPPYLVHFRWDQSAPTQLYSSAVLDYKLITQSSNVLVGWLNQDGSQVGPGADITQVAFIAAPNCSSSIWATPYAWLSADVPLASAGSIGTVQVNTSTPPPVTGTSFLPFPKKPPYDIQIEKERMHITKDTGNGTLTVVRGYLGTPTAAHSAGTGANLGKTTLVMSNGLPPLTIPVTCLNHNGSLAASCPYNTGKQTGDLIQAQMCLTAPTVSNGDGTFTVQGRDVGDGGWSSP